MPVILLFKLLCILLLILLSLALMQSFLSRQDRRRSYAPGHSVNGLHVCQMGESLPAVVLESGLAASCLSWSMVQARLRNLSVSYNRAEIGSPRTAPVPLDAMIADLHSLVQKLEIPQPYILVAHSFGGYIARLYAQRFPHELAGVLLVDPLTPEEWIHPNAAQCRRLRRAIFFTRAAGVLARFGFVRLGLWLILLRKSEKPGPISRYIEVMRRIQTEVRKFPPHLVRPIRANWSRPAFFRNMAAHLKMLPASASVVAGCNFPAGLPVTVLSAPGQPSQVLAAHRAMATRHVVASRGGHFIHLDEPELVIGEVERLATAAL
jgi:pimeloyl-ACP methyl ester carboxylesterase